MHKCRALMDSQENQSGRRSELLELMGGFNSVEYWHGYVQYDNVWFKLFCFGEQVPSISSRPDHLKVALEKSQHALKHHTMVVGDKNSWAVQRLARFRAVEQYSNNDRSIGVRNPYQPKCRDYAGIRQLEELTGGFWTRSQDEIRWCLSANKTKSGLFLRLNNSMM